MRRALSAVAMGAIVALALLAVPASADHGYQSFRFTNKTDKRVFAITVEFDRDLSHIGDETPKGWPGVKCKLLNGETVECESTTRLRPGDDFKLSVATPPNGDGTYERARIDFWTWFNKGGRVGGTNVGCKRTDGCKDLGVQSL